MGCLGDMKPVIGPEGDLKPSQDKGLHCLECGTDLPDDASKCPNCGNEKNILPARWHPPDSFGGLKSSFSKLSNETRILVGLSLALLCTLWMLGSARAGSQVLLNGQQDTGIEIVRADLGNVVQIEEVEITGHPPGTSAQELEPVNIEDARLQANSVQDDGNWFDAVDLWTEVTRMENAVLDDFLALANAHDRVDDTFAALASLNSAIVRFPESPEGYLKLGNLQERMDNLNAARFQYQVGLTYCPGNIDLIENLHRVETGLGLVDETIPDFTPETVPAEIPVEIEPDGSVIVELVVPVIEPVEIEPDPVPENPVQPDTEPEPDIDEPLTLIGGEPDVLTSGTPDSDEPDGDVSDSTTPEEGLIIDILDFEISATNDMVSVNLIVNSPAAFSTSTASDPPRLIVRLPGTRIAPGSSIIRDININVPLVERVHLGEGSADNKTVAILVIYLGENVRHSVSADDHSVRVRIGKEPGEEAG